jgi:hypothetical protein
MRISYAITVCNELEEINNLLTHLIANKRANDEIVVLLDEPNSTKQIQTLLKGHEHAGNITLVIGAFNNNFADWKNLLNSCCTGDYIINIDADEIPSESFQQNIEELLVANPEVDMFIVPRLNIVDGIGLSHVRRWGWNVSKIDGIISEKLFDLNNPKDLDEYELLKLNNLIISEN